MNCLYPECEEVPLCRQENPDYCPYGGHSETENCRGSDYSHKWICRRHWDLLEFLRLSDCLRFDVRMK